MTGSIDMGEIRPTMQRGNPRGMDKMSLGSRSQREFIESQALDIFASMTNGGCTFQQALAAIYLSGMSAGAGVMKEKNT